MPNLAKTIVLLIAFYALTAAPVEVQEQELAPLPVALSAERYRSIASLSPFADPTAASLSQEASRRARDTRESMAVFQRQGLWPIRVETEDGAQYWGEITKIGASTFELLNWKTNQKAKLDYATVRTVEIVKAYPRIKPPSAREKTLQRTGEVVSIILLLPVRILEELFIPRC
jgi:hypothetical protein